MSAPYPKIILKPDREQSWIFGHPWIYSKALKEAYDIPTGTLVEVLSHANTPLGIGYFQKSSTIAVRMLSAKTEKIDASWFTRKLTHLKAYRESFLKGDTTAYRLCYGESDGIPGLVIDIFADVAVIQVNTKGVELLLPLIVESLQALNIDKVQIVADSVSAKKENVSSSIIKSLDDELIWAQENQLHIAIPLQKGQKTGWFCDQRDNRALVRSLVETRKVTSVLNLFAYTGGFSLSAVKGGATHVVSVDVDKHALSYLKKMILKNNLEDSCCTEVVSDVWDFLKTSQEKFDLVIVDPPAFVKQESKKKVGLKGYLDIFKASIPRVYSGGFLMVYSCSHFVTEEDLNWVLRQAFVATKRTFQTVTSLKQGFDHPVPAWFPEGKYLKGFLLKEVMT